MNEFGRNKFQQTMFGLNKFINRKILGKDNAEFMPQYQPVEGVIYGQLPVGYKQTEDVAFKKAAEFNKKEKGRDDLDDILKQTDLNLGNEPAVPKKTNKEKAIDFTKDFIERSLLRRQSEDANLRFGANLQNQQLDALSARNKQALDTQFAFSKFDTSQIAKNQLRAAQREQTMFDAVSRMADVSRLAGAQGSGPRGRAGGA